MVKSLKKKLCDCQIQLFLSKIQPRQPLNSSSVRVKRRWNPDVDIAALSSTCQARTPPCCRVSPRSCHNVPVTRLRRRLIYAAEDMPTQTQPSDRSRRGPCRATVYPAAFRLSASRTNHVCQRPAGRPTGRKSATGFRENAFKRSVISVKRASDDQFDPTDEF